LKFWCNGNAVTGNYYTGWNAMILAAHRVKKVIDGQPDPGGLWLTFDQCQSLFPCPPYKELSFRFDEETPYRSKKGTIVNQKPPPKFGVMKGSKSVRLRRFNFVKDKLQFANPPPQVETLGTRYRSFITPVFFNVFPLTNITDYNQTIPNDELQDNYFSILSTTDPVKLDSTNSTNNKGTTSLTTSTEVIYRFVTDCLALSPNSTDDKPRITPEDSIEKMLTEMVRLLNLHKTQYQWQKLINHKATSMYQKKTEEDSMTVSMIALFLLSFATKQHVLTVAAYRKQIELPEWLETLITNPTQQITQPQQQLIKVAIQDGHPVLKVIFDKYNAKVASEWRYYTWILSHVDQLIVCRNTPTRKILVDVVWLICRMIIEKAIV
jgi:hypothetical protein